MNLDADGVRQLRGADQPGAQVTLVHATLTMMGR
jgi:hypothetical protein